MTPTPVTPFLDGLSMPPRYAPHERTYISWPLETSPYRWSVKEARKEHAYLAKAIAAYERVTLLACPQDAASVSEYLEIGGDIELLEIPLDDAWIRDSGPIFVTNGNRGVAMVNFEFNGWGGRFGFEKCNASPKRIAEWLGMRRYDAPFVLEGGGFTVDGEGTFITTEQFLLNPNRNPNMTREHIESRLRDYLGIERVIWLKGGLVEDAHTDGHSDNIVQCVAPGVALLQTMPDRDNPNFEICKENHRRLREARDAKGRRIEIIEMPILPYTEEISNPNSGREGPTRYPVPYVNYYQINRALIVPMLGGPEDEVAMPILQKAHPERKIVPVPSTAMAADGGGVGCVTQQQPAGEVLQ
jgi:agmatine deiminase